MSEDDPITLSAACEIVFCGAVKPATLRAEAGRGKLELFRIGKRDFTTLRAVREMVERCRVDRPARGSISTRGASNGASGTDQLLSAQAAASATVRELKNLSKNTSGKSISRSRAMTR